MKSKLLTALAFLCLGLSSPAQNVLRVDFWGHVAGGSATSGIWAGVVGGGTPPRFHIVLTVDMDAVGNGGSPTESYPGAVLSAEVSIEVPGGAVVTSAAPLSFSNIEVSHDLPSGGFFLIDAYEFNAFPTGTDYNQLEVRYLGNSGLLSSTDMVDCLVPPAGLSWGLPTPGCRLIIQGPGTTTETLDLWNIVGEDQLFSLENDYSEGCFGDGGDQAGCTNCPCGNNATLGSGGGCMHSESAAMFAGAGARLIPLGSPTLSGCSLVFEMENAVPNSFSVLLSGPSVAPNPAGMNPCVGTNPGSGAQSLIYDGLRCVISGGLGPVLRHGGRPVDSTGAVSRNWIEPEGRWGNGFTFPNSAAFVAGETRHFQAVYREAPGANCGRDLNTTQRVTTTFRP